MQELGRCVTVYRERRFGRTYFELKQLVESLPELLHHLPVVVGVLVSSLEEISAQTPGCPAYHGPGAAPGAEESVGDCARAAAPLLQLLSTIAQEVGAEMAPELHRVLRAVAGAVSGESPELTGAAFRCLSYVVKGSAELLAGDPSQLRRYYGPLLGHGRDFVRRFAAETFTPVLRRLPPKTLRRHLRQVTQ